MQQEIFELITHSLTLLAMMEVDCENFSYTGKIQIKFSDI